MVEHKNSLRETTEKYLRYYFSMGMNIPHNAKKIHSPKKDENYSDHHGDKDKNNRSLPRVFWFWLECLYEFRGHHSV